MSSNTGEGIVHKAKGAVKEAVGHVTGDTKLQAEGKTEKAVGTVQKGVGDVQKKAKDHSR